MTGKTQSKIERVDRLLKMGMTLVNACATVGIKTGTYHKAKREAKAQP